MSAVTLSQKAPERTTLSAGWIAEAVGGRILRGSPNDVIWGVSTDSRSLVPGNLMVALRGAQFDGHKFIKDAGDAAGLLVDERGLSLYGLPPAPSFVISVPDTGDALMELGRAYLRLMNPTVIAITGSVGKTTTKDLVLRLFEGQRAAGTIGNFNNRIGLPLSILAADLDTDYFVAELGISAPGEMSELAKTVTPNIAVLGHIAAAHLEGLSSFETVLDEKCGIFDHWSETGETTAVVADHLPEEAFARAKTADRVLRFGRNTTPKSAHAMAMGFSWNGTHQIGTIKIGDEQLHIRLPLAGEHNLNNLLAAVTAVHSAGAQPNVRALDSFAPSSHRSQIINVGPFRAYDDCYNANPDSMRAAIQTAVEVCEPGRLHLVLGEMLELGDAEIAFHEDLGAWLVQHQPSSVVGLGPLSKHTITNAVAAGLDCPTLHTLSHEEAADFVHQQCQRGDLVLFKGSRSSRIERVLEAWSTRNDLQEGGR